MSTTTDLGHPRQLRLPGQTAAPDGPVDMTIMYVMHHAFRRDLAACLVFPLMPLYQVLMMGVRVIANTQELLSRRSFDDNYVPPHVRRATWRW